ncbi:uncharacterized protein [Drosophila bipectinata]|uniref:uncharacterized protein n=1 Tax=Drosophila bipectinata TaxID=42026 RepID=UPI001C8953FA|nr:uncharacterized protein LOC108119086 [Drosophila bipectinata]
MDHNYAEIDVVNDADFFYLTNLNHYYQQQRLQTLMQHSRHIYCNIPIQDTTQPPPPPPLTKSTSTSPWKEVKPEPDTEPEPKPGHSKKPLEKLLGKPKKWKLKRTLDDFVKCLIIASSEHVYDYDVLW